VICSNASPLSNTICPSAFQIANDHLGAQSGKLRVEVGLADLGEHRLRQQELQRVGDHPAFGVADPGSSVVAVEQGGAAGALGSVPDILFLDLGVGGKIARTAGGRQSALELVGELAGGDGEDDPDRLLLAEAASRSGPE
jgi:hypothetical protein